MVKYGFYRWIQCDQHSFKAWLDVLTKTQYLIKTRPKQLGSVCHMKFAKWNVKMECTNWNDTRSEVHRWNVQNAK